MKKILLSVTAVLSMMAFAGCSKSTGKLKIGIAKIVQHPAMDAIEQGVIDRLTQLGVNAEYDKQNANGDAATATQIANQYKAENVDYAVGIATPVAVALATVITDKPVIFSCVTDPVSAGLIEDVSRGNGNITGLSDAIPTIEQIALFKEIAGIKTLGYIYTSSEANSISALELVREGCKKAGIELVEQSITKSDEVKQACDVIVGKVDGLYLTTDNTVFSAIASVVEVFNKNHKPVFSGDVTAAQNGGIFMASGFNYYKAGLATGDMIYEIINGKNPADIPVKFITKPEDSDLLFDLDVAKDCGITIPENYLNNANMIYQNGALSTK